MKKAVNIGLFSFALLILGSFGAGAADFLQSLEDVPLMDGLVEAPQETVYFDTPSGRIVETYAVGMVTRESVIDFYSASLPSLGWQQKSPTQFEREGENLTIYFEKQEDTALVRFSLSP